MPRVLTVLGGDEPRARYARSSLTPGTRFYDVFPHDEHFLKVAGESSSGAIELALVQNWGEEVERLAPLRE